MSDEDERAVVQQLPVEEAFGLLDHELRVGVVRELAAAGRPLPFSQLYERVGGADSGQFNYHLDKLVGPFVRATEEGYDLTFAGRQVAGAILAGSYTKAVSVEPIELDAACGRCGESLVARFDIDEMVVGCDACDARNTLGFGVPPGILEAFPREAYPEVADRWIRKQLAGVVQGFCYNCDGPIEPTLWVPGDADPHYREVRVEYDCDRCGATADAVVGGHVLTYPPVVAFHHEHGVDLHAVRTWGLRWLYGRHSAVVSTDPLRVEVTVTLDDEALVLTLDDGLDVVATRREDATGDDVWSEGEAGVD